MSEMGQHEVALLCHCAIVVMSGVLSTHNLGFFFGPGLPLSLGGALGSILGGARFLPDMVPPPLFLLASVLGGANELASCSPSSLVGTGVELESDVLSAALSGGWTDGDASAFTACVDCGTSTGNLARESRLR